MLHRRRAYMLQGASGIAAHHALAINSWETRNARGERRRYRANAPAAASGQTAAQKAQSQNQTATQLILAQAQPLIQPIGSSGSISGNNVVQGTSVNLPLNNVGLNTKITIEISGAIACASTETLTKTPLGLANLLSNITLTDLSNFQRVNTTGWHLFLLACMRRQSVYGAAFANDSPVAMGSNWIVNSQPSTVTPAGSVNFRMFFELPLAFHESMDLRGAIWANVTGAQWRLGLTFNPNIVAAANATDSGFSCWKSNSNTNIGVVSNIAYTIYQHFFDQLPVSGNSQVLPTLSLAYNYMLINTIGNSALVQNVDLPVQYANFRTYYSTIAIFDNAGTYNTGTDVNYIAIQSANLVYLQKFDPYMATLQTRNWLGDDPPPGVYIVNHRRRPISTTQYGNMQFILNAAQVNAGATLQMGYEMLAIQSQAINAGSLAAV